MQSGFFSVYRFCGNLCLALFLSCSVVGTSIAAEQSVLEMLMRMQTATQTLNYHGTLVYLQNGQVQSMRVVHRADQRGEFERLINLNGVAREIVRKNDVVTSYMPNSKVALVCKQQSNGNVLAKLAENDFSQLQDYYGFSFGAVGRVAGQDVRAILIKPKDAFRYGYRLWVDESNAILLKSDLISERGKVLEQTMFADITINADISDAMLKAETRDDGFTWFRHEDHPAEQERVTSRWDIVSLPQGFSITARLRHQMPSSPGFAEHWVISDGLASISVYIEKILKGQMTFEGASPMGATNAFGMLSRGHQITVIGEVPSGTVETLAHAVMYDAKVIK